MTLRFSKKEKLIAFAGIALLLIVFSGLYFLYLQPLKADLEHKQNELNSENQLLSVIENQVQSIRTDTLESTETLQKQIPVKPLVEQLLLDIEKAEVVSGSFVSDMEFSDGEITEQVNENSEEVDTNSTEDGTEQTGEEQPSIILPSGMKKTTVTLNVQSPSYFDMEKFIATLESQPRIIVVDELDITGWEEIISTDQEKQFISFEITISAFFMPNLSDLIDHLPKMDVPNPSNKKNPFTSFGSITSQQENMIEEKEDANIVNSEESNLTGSLSNNNIENSYTGKGAIKYTVQPGDNLYRISMKFYNSREGENIIKERNGLRNNTVIVGQVLEIPIEER